MKTIKFLLFIFLITSCQKEKSEQPKINQFNIGATITGFKDSTKVFLKNLNTDKIIDSTTIISNKFSFSGKFDSKSPEMLWVYISEKDNFYYSNLLIGNENIKIKGDIKDFPFDLKISGSKSQKEADILTNLTKKLDNERSSLVDNYLSLSKEDRKLKGKEIWKKIHKIDAKNDSITKNYLLSNLNTYNGLVTLGYNKEILPKDTIQKLFKDVSPELKSSKYGKAIETFLSNEVLKVGDNFYDFEAFNQKNEKTTLSKFVNGKYILINFTATYCGACVQAAEELQRISKDFNDKINLVSFCVDKNEEDRNTHIKRDKVDWLCLWDNKGRYSETYIRYGINGTPTYFLINPEGKIIDKQFGYEKGLLEKFLKRNKAI